MYNEMQFANMLKLECDASVELERVVIGAPHKAGGAGVGARASRHVDAERAAGVLVHHVRDGHGRDHLDEVGRDAAVQPAQALALHDLAERTAHRALRALRCFL